MANDPPSPSHYPSSMGPGARPMNKPEGGESQRTKLMQVIQARSKYQVAVEEETLSLSYELNDAPRLYRLSFDAMPIQGLTKWWIYGGPQRARKAGVLAIDVIRGFENSTKRPITQQEAEGLTYWTSQRMLYSSVYGPAVAITLATYFARRGHARMKFPFMTARPLSRYNHFPFPKSTFVTGERAQGLWQFARYTVWVQLALFAFAPIVSAVGSVQVATGMASDSRVQGIVRQLKEQIQNEMPESQEQRQWESRDGSQRQGQGTGQDSQSDFQADYKSFGQGGQADPASDGGGNLTYPMNGAMIGHEADLRATYEPASASETGTFSDAATGDQDPRGGYSGYAASRQSQSRQMPPTKPSDTSDSDPFFYDDASPTKGNNSDDASPTAYSAPSGGSVWDRIRRGQAQPQPQSPRSREVRSSRPLPQDADSDNRNAYATEPRVGKGRDGRDREQAQREFDEMLERERQQSGSGEYDRGMRAVEHGEESRGTGGIGVWERRRGDE